MINNVMIKGDMIATTMVNSQGTLIMQKCMLGGGKSND